MRFVADENLDGPVVERLRSDGHEVTYIAELEPGIRDEDVLALSIVRGCVLLTADKDFGDLVFRQRLTHCGILLIRLAGLDLEVKADLVSSVIGAHARDLEGAFSVLTEESLRIRRPLHPGGW